MVAVAIRMPGPVSVHCDALVNHEAGDAHRIDADDDRSPDFDRELDASASRSGRPTYAVVPLREATLIASGSRPNRRRMSATAMYGRDVRYRRRLDVLGRLLADMDCVGSLRLRRPGRGEAVRLRAR